MAGTFNQPSANPTGTGGAPNPQNQQPEHRLKELETKLRNLELQNVQLRTTLNHVNQPNNPAAQPAADPNTPVFDPSVKQAINSLVEAKLQPIQTQYQYALGALHDQVDEAKFNQKYGGEKFKPYMPKVQEMRQDAIAQNRFIGREDALKLVFFESEGKKAQPAKIEPTHQPQWDQNLGSFVHPGTTEPWYPGQPVKTPAPVPTVDGQVPVQTPGQPVVQPQQVPGQPPQQLQQVPPQQVPQQVPPQGPQQVQSQEPQPFFQPEFGQQTQPAAQIPLQTPQVPVQNNFQAPQLPDASPNPVGNFQDPNAMSIDLDSSPEDLDAWERKYGDQPL